MKCIPIPSCAKCPHRDHRGAFAPVAYVPICQMAARELPHEVHTRGTLQGHRMVASQTEGIPDWCPLPDTEDCI